MAAAPADPAGSTSVKPRKSRKAMTCVLKVRSDGITTDTKDADLFAVLKRMKPDLKFTHLRNVLLNGDRHSALVEVDGLIIATELLNCDKPVKMGEHTVSIAPTTRENLGTPRLSLKKRSSDMGSSLLPYRTPGLSPASSLDSIGESRIGSAASPTTTPTPGGGSSSGFPSPRSSLTRTSGFECKVESYEVREKKYAVYQLAVFECETGRPMGQVYRRFSEIQAFHDDLVNSDDVLFVPLISAIKFPPKTLTRSVSEKFLNKRQSALQKYLSSLFSKLADLKINPTAVPLFCEFFAIRAPKKRSSAMMAIPPGVPPPPSFATRSSASSAHS